MRSGIMTNYLGLFLIVHIVLTIIYTIVLVIKDRYLGLCRGAVVLMLPGIGFLSYLVMDILSLFDHKVAYFDQDELMAKIDKSSYKQLPNEDEELNVVPIAEVLAVSSNTDKRRVILDFLKVDHSKMEGFATFMLESLDNGDVETTHYVASSLFELSRARTKKLRRLWQSYEDNPSDPKIMGNYLQVLLDYIQNERLTNKDLEKYKGVYVEVFKKLMEQYPELIVEKDLENIVEIFIRFKDYDDALKWCRQFMDKFPRSEIPYVLKLDVYFRQKNNQKFTESLNDLMASSIQLSNSTWKLVRRWSNR